MHTLTYNYGSAMDFSIIDLLYFFAKIMRDVISEFYSNISAPT